MMITNQVIKKSLIGSNPFNHLQMGETIKQQFLFIWSVMGHKLGGGFGAFLRVRPQKRPAFFFSSFCLHFGTCSNSKRLIPRSLSKSLSAR